MHRAVKTTSYTHGCRALTWRYLRFLVKRVVANFSQQFNTVVLRKISQHNNINLLCCDNVHNRTLRFVLRPVSVRLRRRCLCLVSTQHWFTYLFHLQWTVKVKLQFEFRFPIPRSAFRVNLSFRSFALGVFVLWTLELHFNVCVTMLVLTAVTEHKIT